MDIFKLIWFMRGGITHQEALMLSPDDREIIGKLVKENIETTKKTGQPFFQNIVYYIDAKKSG